MKKALLLSAFCCVFSHFGYAQKSKSFLMGTETAFVGVYSRDRINETKHQFSYLSLDPYIGYFITDFLALGVTGEIDFQWETDKEMKTYQAAGVFLKTVFPVLPNHENKYYRRLNFAGGAAYLKDNYFYEDFMQFPIAEQKFIKLSAGPSFRFWERWGALAQRNNPVEKYRRQRDAQILVRSVTQQYLGRVELECGAREV